MKHIIAITMRLSSDDAIAGGMLTSSVHHEYGEAVRAAGGQPIFIDSSSDPAVIAGLADGVVISGGNDIDPLFYGQENAYCRALEPRARTEWENRLIDACDAQSVPILGVCYGCQLLNVHYGGTLYQDIATETGSTLDHGADHHTTLHDVTFDADMLGYKRGDVMPSTARHHQAVHELATGFMAAGHASDGTIEAIQGLGHFGIQWHPESGATAAMIYGEFIRHCVEQAASTHQGVLV
ncbi:MAG TPA: gamma-glutamyl-gamma-aminobutyrate hydrolase family protein [Candidatus Saccharimonadaceae bacterium]|nr:gamma-glutamyl-gamma-aminobutyrate hydrolase family protein [Candidatus Saccharimonadaceae bacterium]